MISKVFAADLIGKVTPPAAIGKYSPGPEGLFSFINNILKLLIYGAGLFALFNFIFAGYGFITAGGDAEKMNIAWSKIWQSILGLLVAAGAFVIAGVIGLIIFGDAGAILQPKLYKP